jgi:hypothetical protein
MAGSSASGYLAPFQERGYEAKGKLTKSQKPVRNEEESEGDGQGKVNGDADGKQTRC